MLKQIFILVCLFLFNISAFGEDKIYFLPDESNKAKEEITSLIENAHNSIDILMYNFDYNKFHNALKKALDNGTKVTLIYDKSKLNFDKRIVLKTTKRKLHIKLAIIDNQIAIFGSANWKKESFGKNYEIINITDDIKKLKKFNNIFEQIEKEN